MKLLRILITSAALFSGHMVTAQTAADLQELLEQRANAGANSPSLSLPTSPIDPFGRTQNSLTTNPEPGVEQFYDQPRDNVLLPGELSPEAVFPEQLPMENPPFAANLFLGGFETERSRGLVDNYLVAAGDKIAVRMWGTINFSDVLTVDNQGNIFIPSVGPVSVLDVAASAVNQVVESNIRRIYKEDVNVYVDLLSATPVAIYVTGPVVRPGQYAGNASDSPLYFLKRAGGIDFQRGSFRNITLLRDNQALHTVDLYQFILHGKMPDIAFQDGDVLLVSPIGRTITVAQGAKNSFTFELSEKEETGQNLVSFARPNRSVNRVVVHGIRAQGRMAKTLSLDSFQSFKLEDGDKTFFFEDHRATSFSVEIMGSNAGQAHFSVDAGTSLHDVLLRTQINREEADIDNIFLLRESVAEQQKTIIDASLDRLERSVFTAPISSTGEGAIRVQEAQLVTDFISRARQVNPLGKVVLSEAGKVANIRLEANDVIVIPFKTDLVHVGGEVMMPQSVVFNREGKLTDYIAWAGGYTERANERRIMVIKANGNVDFFEGDGAFWMSEGNTAKVSPGDQVVVLPRIDAKSLQTLKDITQIIYQIAVAANVAID